MTSGSPEQRVALITGSGRERVGSVIAEYFAKKGFRIALHFRTSKDEARATRDRLLQLGVGCEAYQADVSRDEDVGQMVTAVQKDFGRIDLLVTTASVWSPTPLNEITAENLQSNFAVNTLGTFFTARAVGNVMVKQPDGGSIVTMGDWAIERPYLHHAAYLISKGTLPTLTRTLALELGHLNPRVRVNCIHPGPVMFPPGTPDQEQQQLINSTLVKQANCPEMVAHAVEFLLGNSFITGACIPIDGGRHMFAVSDLERR